MRRAVALVILLGFVPSAAARSPTPLVVTNFGDAGAGTLRAAVAAAQPGATITFARAAVVHLGRPVIVPGTLPGLTIDGHAGGSRVELQYVGGPSGLGGRGVLDVLAD